MTMITAWKSRQKRIVMVIDDHDGAQKSRKTQELVKGTPEG
jgi:hypothetical protein